MKYRAKIQNGGKTKLIFCKMKFRVRLGKQRLGIEVEHENCTVENLKAAICNALSIRYIKIFVCALIKYRNLKAQI